MSNTQSRLTHVQSLVQPRQVLVLFSAAQICAVTRAELSTEDREGLVCITSTACYFFCSPLFAPKKSTGVTIDILAKKNLEAFFTACSESGKDTLLYDPTTLTCSELTWLQERAPSLVCTAETELFTHTLWTKKTKQELAACRAAGKLSLKIMEAVCASLAVGDTELAVALRIKRALLENGAAPSFPPIVAFGKNTAVVHHTPTQSQLTAESPVLIDLGARLNACCADMTRTIWFGKRPSKLFVSLQERVLRSTEAAVLAAQTTPTHGAAIDAAARESIVKDGYGEAFIHSTGHGLGFAVHERPHIGPTSKDPVVAGQCITIEPGIYLSGKMGYRHEDTYTLTERGTCISYTS